ncbi:integration host factor, actinobacterial type [Streptacidiphilus sp. PAMC 29251]
MALPQLTATDRTDALARALVVRRERSELLTSLKEGRVTLSELLSTQGDTVGKIPVRRLLEALPGIGKVRAAQTMAEFQIADNRRIQGLGARQRELLRERFSTAQ